MSDSTTDLTVVITLIMVFVLLAILGMVGYLVWSTNQKPDIASSIKQFLRKPLVDKPVASPSGIHLGDKYRNKPCRYVSGDIADTCKEIDFAPRTGILTAKCLANDGDYYPSILDVNNCVNCGVTNINGTLGCSQGAKPGMCNSYGGNWLSVCEIDFNPITGDIVTKCPNEEGKLVQSNVKLSNCNSTSGCNINNVDGTVLCSK